MTKVTDCPKEFSDCNPENTPCGYCGSRIHYTLNDGLIRCSWCDIVIDESFSMLTTPFDSETVGNDGK